MSRECPPRPGRSLRLVEQVKDDEIVAPGTENAERAAEIVRVAIEVRDGGDDAAFREPAGGVRERLSPVGTPFGLQLVEAMVERLEIPLAGPRRNVGPRVFVEDEEPYRIVLARCNETQCRSEIAGIPEFRRCANAAERVHGRAAVEEHEESGIGLALEQLQQRPVGAGIGVPVDEARVVAGNVVAIFRELLAEAGPVGVVGTVHYAVDYGPRYQI